jgi:hypothetical protein
MKIPEGFQFSSSSLQDFEDCRSASVRYLQQVAWPAVQSGQPWKANGIQLGALPPAGANTFPEFLLLSCQPPSGMSSWSCGGLISGPDSALLPQPTPPIASPRYRSQHPKAHRLLAKLDFTCRFPDGSWRIYDWKTNLKRPARSWLQKSLQTRLYPYLLVRASAALNLGQAVHPGQVSMTYWFSAVPDQPETFTYSLPQYEMDEAYLSGMISVIESLDESGFVKTDRLEACRYCVYRSLCDRGTAAGDFRSLGRTAGRAEVSFDLTRS